VKKKKPRRYYINKDYKYIYYVVPKVCTRTIMIWLNKNKYLNFHKYVVNKEGKQYPSPYYNDLLHKKHYEFFTFAFCRNPFDRLVSLYHDKVIKTKTSSWDIKFYKKWKNVSFDTFVSALCEVPCDELDGHARFQNSLIPEHISFLGRFENFTEDFDYVTNTLFSKSFKQNAIHQNKTQHKHYSEYYNKSLIQKVYKKYHQDFERFGYTF